MELRLSFFTQILIRINPKMNQIILELTQTNPIYPKHFLNVQKKRKNWQILFDGYSGNCDWWGERNDVMIQVNVPITNVETPSGCGCCFCGNGGTDGGGGGCSGGCVGCGGGDQVALH